MSLLEERCPGQDSNLHGHKPGDFKSPASTHSATRAATPFESNSATGRKGAILGVSR
jgi:hypothetical protein